MEDFIRVVLVHPSLIVRKAISSALAKDGKIIVVAMASDEVSALEIIQRHGPDVALISTKVPHGDSCAVVEELMKDWPLPIIVMGDESSDQGEILESMHTGAIDFILLPKEGDIDGIATELIQKTKVAAIARLPRKKALEKLSFGARIRSKGSDKVIVIGVSTGGPQTLEKLLPQFPKHTPVPILIVQHIPSFFTKSLAVRLDGLCEIEVREAKDGERLEAGTALIAPGGFHMIIEQGSIRGERKVRLTTDEPEWGLRPTANHLFASVAPLYKEGTIAVVLTGMGSDGTSGAGIIKRYQGTVIVEAEESCVIFGMPKEVIKAGYADEVVPLDKMAVAILQLLET